MSQGIHECLVCSDSNNNVEETLGKPVTLNPALKIQVNNNGLIMRIYHQDAITGFRLQSLPQRRLESEITVL